MTSISSLNLDKIFLSWIEVTHKNGKETLFLTDKVAFSSKGTEIRRNRYSYLGSLATYKCFPTIFDKLRSEYPELCKPNDRGAHNHLVKECHDIHFWDASRFPLEIAVHLGSPEKVIKTWGRMLKASLNPDQIVYIVKYAPNKYIRGLRDILAQALIRSHCLYILYETFPDTNSSERSAILRTATEDSEFAESVFGDPKLNFSKTERQLLLKSISKDRVAIINTVRDHPELLDQKDKDQLERNEKRLLKYEIAHYVQDW